MFFKCALINVNVKKPHLHVEYFNVKKNLKLFGANYKDLILNFNQKNILIFFRLPFLYILLKDIKISKKKVINGMQSFCTILGLYNDIRNWPMT